MGCCHIPEKSLEEVAGRVEAINILSIITVTFGALCACFGIPTLILMEESVFPFNTGIGIVNGVMAIFCGVFGLLFVKEVRSHQLTRKMLCYGGVHQGLYHCVNSLAGVQMAFSISALFRCSEGPATEGCGGVNWSANYLLAAVNVSMAVIVWFVTMSSICITWKVHGLARKLAKVQCMTTT